MKITKKRMLKLGFKEDGNSVVFGDTTKGKVTINFAIEKVSMYDISKGRNKELGFFKDYEHLCTYCKSNHGISLPKKRSLKKAVKGLKKMIDVNSKAIELLMEAPTSAENAQVEKPIEFGCWVEEFKGIDPEQIGTQGVFHYEESGVAHFVTKDLSRRGCPIENLKRIKSPIE